MKHINIGKVLIAAILTCTIAGASLSACSAVPDDSQKALESTASSSSTSAVTSLTGTVTEKDLETQYDESGSVTITLNGDSAESDSSSVSIDGSVLRFVH